MRAEPESAEQGHNPARRPPWKTIALLGLMLTTVVTSTGWFLTAREGRGVPPECYTLDSANQLRFDATHGRGTVRSTFAVEERDDEVMLGYWEQVDDGTHPADAYNARLTFLLVQPIGDRKVVDPAGNAIPQC